MQKKASGLCNTPYISVSTAQSILNKAGLENHILKKPLTLGGISRVFETTNEGIVVKITSIASPDRQWGKFEGGGYDMLKEAGIPCAKVLDLTIYGKYLILVVENLSCSMSSLIKTSSLSDLHGLNELISALKSVLHTLFVAGLAYVDLSPDNIMFDIQTRSLKLIDPQFVVSRDLLEERVGKVWATNLDTTCLALKIFALGLIKGDIRSQSRIISGSLLNKRPPAQRVVVKWLRHDMPMFLHEAYSLLQQQKNVHV
jgi:hypothetical protein